MNVSVSAFFRRRLAAGQVTGPQTLSALKKPAGVYEPFSGAGLPAGFHFLMQTRPGTGKRFLLQAAVEGRRDE